MNRKRGYLYILLAAMIYSTTEVALKGLGGVFAPMQITVERVLIGALFLLPFALCSLRQNAIRLTRSDWSYFALLGFLTVTLHMSLLQMAVLHMDASATSIIYSGNPVFALAAAHLILHEPLKRNHLIAIGVELIGILFILNPAKLEVSPRGFAEILTATVLFAMYGTLCKLRIPRLGGLVITTFNIGPRRTGAARAAAARSHPRRRRALPQSRAGHFRRRAVLHRLHAQVRAAAVLRRHLLRRHRLSAHRQDHGIHLRDRGLLRLSDQARSGNAFGGGLLPRDHQRQPHDRPRLFPRRFAVRQLARAARDAAGRCYGAAAAVSPFSRKKAPAVFTVGAFSSGLRKSTVPSRTLRS